MFDCSARYIRLLNAHFPDIAVSASSTLDLIHQVGGRSYRAKKGSKG